MHAAQLIGHAARLLYYYYIIIIIIIKNVLI